MKQLYEVQRMTYENYNNYLSGNYYWTEHVRVEAKSAEEAVSLAQANGYYVNNRYVRTVAEVEAEAKARREAYEAAEAKAAKRRAAAKARREAKKAAQN